MTKKRLYIVSLDAFGDADLEFARTLPHFKELMGISAQVTGIRTVYPSLTYMAHTSIATGMYPNQHGITNNTLLQPERISPDWFWYEKAIKTPTIFQVAKQAGYTIGSLLWPVTGRSKVIDYNLAEIFPNRPWQNQIMVSGYASSLKYTVEMNNKFKHLRNGIEQPQLDDFIIAVAVDTIINKKPDMMAIHLVDLDSTRHKYGVNSTQAKEAIVRMDKHLGQILRALSESGMKEDTVLAVLGDHYQIDTHTVIRPNHLFVDKGWVTVNKRNQITDWKVILKSADGSAYIYRKDPTITNKMILDALKGIDSRLDNIFGKEDFKYDGVDENAIFILEAKRGYYFKDDIIHPFMESTAKTIKGRTLAKAAHGFHPDKNNYQTMLLLSGPGINKDARLNGARLVDEGPTLLHAIGLRFPNKTDGHVLKDLFL
ncbi:alkaline phosphatase family protein [Jeotgalibaca sp. A122]|uniref:alkaline phosphatase family protein n=1 Tax=Jeotgalibaca sp. A122 TaxID=3457322 RepID=UPI003FD20164